MKRRMFVIFASMFLLLHVVAAAQSFEFPVEHKRTLRDHRGTLVITPEKIEYKTAHKGESRSWRYEDIQQIKVESPTELEILTYEDQKRSLGRDRVFKFKLMEGRITPEISALLMASATRPTATSVLPVAAGSPTFEIPVKHLHTFGGCEGTLNIYPDRVTYESADKPEDSRYWRYPDIQSFSHPTRYRFNITTFEDEPGGSTRGFNFELKKAFPEQAYDYLWVRIHPLDLYPRVEGSPALAAGAEGQRPQITSAPNKEPEARPAEAPLKEPEPQPVKVILTNRGYEPASITLQRGIPARIEFVRQVEGGCGEEIVIPEYGIKRELPLNKPVVVEFTPRKTGEFVFTCGMNMLRGKIVVQEREDSPVVAGEARHQEETGVRKEIVVREKSGSPAAKAEAEPRPEIRAPKSKPEVQTATVILTEGGYSPGSIRLRRGTPARITFVRKTDKTCGTEVVIPEYKIKRELPLNKPVVVGFMPNKSGEFAFACGMNMLRGKVVVQ